MNKNFKDTIMEKIALNAASKRHDEGILSLDAYRKIRKYEDAMHSKGTKPISSLHDRINSRQKASIPAKGTVKNYSARSTGYKERIPEVLGTMRTSKFLGRQNSKTLGKIKSLGIDVLPTDKTSDFSHSNTRTQYFGNNHKISGARFQLALQNGHYKKETPMGDISIRGNLLSKRLTDKATRTTTASHETAEARESVKKLKASKLISGALKRLSKNNGASIGSHCSPDVLLAERDAINRLRDFPTKHGYKVLRDSETIDTEYGATDPNETQQHFMDRFFPTKKVTEDQRRRAYNYLATGDENLSHPLTDAYRKTKF